METLNRDAMELLQISKPNKTGMTLLESLGYDVDTPYGEIMHLTTVSDT